MAGLEWPRPKQIEVEKAGQRRYPHFSPISEDEEPEKESEPTVSSLPLAYVPMGPTGIATLTTTDAERKRQPGPLVSSPVFSFVRATEAAQDLLLSQVASSPRSVASSTDVVTWRLDPKGLGGVLPRCTSHSISFVSFPQSMVKMIGRPIYWLLIGPRVRKRKWLSFGMVPRRGEARPATGCRLWTTLLIQFSRFQVIWPGLWRNPA